jgi:hypothetical protein
MEEYISLMRDPDFLRFRNELSRGVYEALGRGYAGSDNEVGLVTKMVEATNGKTYRNMKIVSEKIHGAKSYVQFAYKGSPVTKELGDMLVISVVSRGRERLLQKLCIIQNKVLRKGVTKIDEEQLFLLKNFPPFSASQGIYAGASDVMMFNRSKCLGAYLFFDWPGEASYLTAKYLFQVLGGKSSFKRDLFAHLSPSESAEAGNTFGVSMGFPWLGDPMMFEDMLYRFHKRGYCPLFPGQSMSPLSSGGQFLDVHDFINAWLTLGVGELTSILGNALDSAADRLATSAMRAVGMSEILNLQGENVDSFNQNDMAVLVLHIDIASV